MTAAQHADIIRAHWKLLWPLPTKQRMHVLDELILDYEFSEQMFCVEREMSCPEITTSLSLSPSSAHF